MFEKYLRKQVIDYVTTKYEKINTKNFAFAHGLRNSKCHWNAADEVNLNGGDIYVTIAIHKYSRIPYLHFINCQNGVYKDITYGYSFAQQFDYYIIKKLRYYSEMDMITELDIQKLRIINFVFSKSPLIWKYAKHLNKTDDLI